LYFRETRNGKGRIGEELGWGFGQKNIEGVKNSLLVSQGLVQLFPDLRERRDLNAPRNLMSVKFFNGS
jgi:hypothetical protein